MDLEMTSSSGRFSFFEASSLLNLEGKDDLRLGEHSADLGHPCLQDHRGGAPSHETNLFLAFRASTAVAIDPLFLP